MQASFDHIASEYDKSFTHSNIGKMQREMVWEYLDDYLSRNINLNVLELNCGTGEDAIHIAEQGHQVLATDASQAMIEVAQTKVSAQSLHQSVSLEQMGFEDFKAEKFSEKFDLIFSNFGGLNCISPITIREVSLQMSKLLKPGGRFIAVIMPQACWWERFYFSVKLKWKDVFRRSQHSVKAHVDGQWVDTWYYSPKLFQELAGDRFSKGGLKPIGIVVPPSFLESFFENKMVLLKGLFKLEKGLNKISYLSKFSDHYLIDLRLAE